MPRNGRKTRVIKRAKKADDMLYTCKSCGKDKKKSEFYVSYSELDSATGVLPYCKDCVRAMCSDKFGKLNKDRLLQMLRKIDRPYIDKMYKRVINENEPDDNNLVGKYLRYINMKQYRPMKWLDGDLDKLDEKNANLNPPLMDIKKYDPVETTIEKFEDFKVNDDIIKLFGTGYTDEEYFHMWNKYQFLSQNYTETTNMHTEALVTYVRYKVREEMATAAGKAKEAKDWGDLAMKQAERAKLNPNQFSKADLQGGLTTIGEIAQAVEENVDIIPILPQFKYRPNDAVDFCIWNYINYARALEGKPLVEYEDVYKFYDTMRDNYISSTGDPYHIFDKDPTLENRGKVKQFIQLPKEYNEKEDED